MSSPNKSHVHVNRPLLNFSLAYMQDPNAFVADRVSPIVEVTKQSDLYFEFDRRAFMSNEVRERGDAEDSHGAGYKVSTEPYYCTNYSLHKDIGDQTRANTDSPLNADRNAVQFLTHQHLINKEMKWAEVAFNAAAWGSVVTGASNTFWDDYVNSDPIGVIDDLKAGVIKLTGRKPNKIVLGIKVRNKLKEHPLLVDRIKYTSSALAHDAEIARLLGLDEVLTAYSVVDQAAPNALATDNKFVLDERSALLLYTPSAPSIESPASMLTFSWSGLNGARAAGMDVTKFRREENSADRIRADCAFVQKIVGKDLGVFLDKIVQA